MQVEEAGEGARAMKVGGVGGGRGQTCAATGVKGVCLASYQFFRDRQMTLGGA